MTPDAAADTPLAGFTVGVTADRRAGEQIELLERRGAAILHGPTIRTNPLGDEGRLADATREVIADPPTDVVLLTALGIRSWLEAAESLALADDLLEVLRAARVWVRGAKARGAAATLGLDVPGEAPATSVELTEALLATDVAGRRVAVQLDGAGNAPLLARLTDAGAGVVAVPVYRWSLPEDTAPAERLVRSLVDGRVDAVTFTTQTAIVHLLQIARGIDATDAVARAFASRVQAVCVGPVCAGRARQVGFGRIIEPPRARLGSMVLEFARQLDAEVLDIQAAGETLHLQGRLVTCGDGLRVALTDRERDVLRALADAGGRVVSKHQLLGLVWGTREHDTHLVEVTVGRLRQRLGRRDVIDTVHRRGYRLSA